MLLAKWLLSGGVPRNLTPEGTPVSRQDTAAALLRRIKANPVRRRPTPMAARNRQALINALETARRAVCAYGPDARTCDCKYGLVPDNGHDFQPAVLHSEETGCPELRDMIHAIQAELDAAAEAA